MEQIYLQGNRYITGYEIVRDEYHNDKRVKRVVYPVSNPQNFIVFESEDKYDAWRDSQRVKTKQGEINLTGEKIIFSTGTSS